MIRKIRKWFRSKNLTLVDVILIIWVITLCIWLLVFNLWVWNVVKILKTYAL